MRVRFAQPMISKEAASAAASTLMQRMLTNAGKVAAFEEAFTDYIGGGDAVAVSSCTAALHIAAMALGLKPGDEVIMPAQTFAASFSSDGSRWNNALDLTGRQTEIEAYRLTAAVADLAGETFKFDGGTFKPKMLPAQVDREIEGILRTSYDPNYLNNSAFGWGLLSPP